MIACAISTCGERAERIIDGKGFCDDHTPRDLLPLTQRCHVPGCIAPATRIVFGKPVCADNTHRPQA